MYQVGPVELESVTSYMLRKLPPREWLVVSLRFSLRTSQTYTLREIALPMGITRQAVHQIERRAMRRLGDWACVLQLLERWFLKVRIAADVPTHEAAQTAGRS